jgi:hypothetical protein
MFASQMLFPQDVQSWEVYLFQRLGFFLIIVRHFRYRFRDALFGRYPGIL